MTRHHTWSAPRSVGPGTTVRTCRRCGAEHVHVAAEEMVLGGRRIGGDIYTDPPHHARPRRVEGACYQRRDQDPT